MNNLLSTLHNEEVQLHKTPGKVVQQGDFNVTTSDIVTPEEGQIVVEVNWLSMDMYLYERAVGNRMGPQLELGKRIPGRGTGVVVAGALPIGTRVMGNVGWQRYATVDAQSVQVLSPDANQESLYLSVLGVPGLTAWIGLNKVLNMKPGQTLLVSSAAGTVGQIVCQLALDAGLKVVGIAGGPKKAAHLKEIGVPRIIDRISVTNWNTELRSACPEGLDGYFDNVGGETLNAAVQNMNPGGRILLCGHRAEYDGTPASVSTADILYKRISLDGFLVWDHATHFKEARLALHGAVGRQALKVNETVFEGLKSVPAAFEAMMLGKGQGKFLVRVQT